VTRRLPALALAPLLFLSGCERAVLYPAGAVAAGDKQVLLNAVTVMLGIVVPVILATLAFAWWFRASNRRAKYRPEWDYSGRIELLVWSVPALAVIFIAGIGWVGSHRLDPWREIEAKQPPLDVEVVSLDWKWLFIYPREGIASVNHLVVPVGRPLRLRLTSATVMNSFFVPRLGSQIYTMAGMTTRLNLIADQPGRYRGLSANYSGKGFPGMTFPADAVPAAQFDGWVAAAKKAGPLLDSAGYHQLTRESTNVAPFTYRAVAPRLFDSIIHESGTTNARAQIDGRQQ
jgi:cytochrome o ubiquinol oxidase subunit II